LKYLKEQEELRKRDKYTRWQQKEIARANENMMKGIKQIKCRRMFNCPNRDTQFCFTCKYNTACFGVNDYYKEKIPGVKFL